MSDDKNSDERYHNSKNDEDRVTDDIEFFKLGNLSSNKNDDNIDKQSDERNRMDMCGDKNFDEKYQIDKNDEERVTNDIEVLKPGNWVCRKIQTIMRDHLMKEIEWI